MPPSRKHRKTGVIEALIMGVVYVPEELKEMGSRMEEIIDVVRIQNTILCELLPQSAKSGCQLKELSGLGKKLDAMNNSLEVIRDFVGFK
jgi:hypothetical protein